MRKFVLLFAFTFSLSAFGADLAGKWKVTIRDASGPKVKVDLTLKQDGDQVSGTLSSALGSAPLQDVVVKGDVLTCRLDLSGTAASARVTLQDGKLIGSYSTGDGNTGTIEAERKGTAAPAPAPAPAAAATLAGAWKISTEAPDGTPVEIALTLKQESAGWTGQAGIEEFGLTLALADLKVDGPAFTCDFTGPDGIYTVAAKLAGDRLEGVYTAPDGAKTKLTGTR